MITALELKIGSETGLSLRLPLEPAITIFVGPNNSGKSLALREIASYCATGQDTGFHILRTLEFAPVNQETAQHDLDAITAPSVAGETVGNGHRRVLGPERDEQIRESIYFEGRANPQARPNYYAHTYSRFLYRQLDGASRLGLLGSQPLGDLKNPQGLLGRMFANNDKRKLIRDRVYQQLGLYLALDATHTGQLSVRLSPTLPPNEKSWDDETVNYMRQAHPIDSFSDGVRAFCGMMSHIHAGFARILIVDEPEAFLAPPLAHTLGKELAGGARSEGKHIFAATHSSHFLMGAIASGARVNIIRLTYAQGGHGTARLLEAEKLSKLMNDPMLRSANVLSALFYRGVVVGEADADRAFYQECNERLLSKNDSRAAADTLFINANGKAVIAKIVDPLRQLGIPTAAAIDLDILKNGGAEWIRHLRACRIPQPDHDPCSTRRKNALSALDAADAEWKRNGGLAVLTGDERIAAEGLLEELSRYGVFILERGEVEAWLSDLNVSRNKHTWLHSIFEKMGSDPTSNTYVHPAPGDVWDFLGRIASWLKDENRRGLN